jgi:hypothetical protein
MHRFFLAALALFGALSTALAPGPASAAPPYSLPFVLADDSNDAHMKKGATLEGTVTAVDYAANTFTLDVGSRKVLVIVKPSTDFEGSPGYHSMTDVAKGTSVSVLSSVVGDKTFAEIVTLRGAAPKPAH